MERLKYLFAGSEQDDPLIRALLAGVKPSFLCLRDECGREEEWELFAVLPFQGELYAEIGRRNDGAGTHLFCRMGHGSEDFILYPEHTAATVSALMAIKNQQREVPSRPASAGGVHITGDTHGDISRFFVGQPTEETGWSARDTLIVCGDFGYIFSADRFEERLLDLLEQKPYTICFCDGNHDHIPAICSYPETQWNGGRAHRIRRNLYHLMRGQVYEINGKSFFTMGGAYSLDRQRRQEGVSFWHEELPSAAEYHEAVQNLRRAGNRVDCIITHTAPRDILYRLGKYPDRHEAELTGFLEWIEHDIHFGQWFFGHLHEDLTVGERFRAVFTDIVTVT